MVWRTDTWVGGRTETMEDGDRHWRTNRVVGGRTRAFEDGH